MLNTTASWGKQMPDTYPWARGNRLTALQLDHAVELSVRPTPPQTAGGVTGAAYKPWIDTTSTPPALRLAKGSYSATYNAAEWLTIGYIANRFTIDTNFVDLVPMTGAGAYLGPQVLGSGSTTMPMLTGPTAVPAGANDFFIIAQRLLNAVGPSGTWYDGPYINLRGTNAPSNAGAIVLQTGWQALGYHQFTFDTSGNLTLGGSLNAGAASISGSMTVGGLATVNGVYSPTMVGAAAANATLDLYSTNSAAPAGDVLTLHGTTITLRARTGTSVINVGVANVTSGVLVMAGAASGAQNWVAAPAASGQITFPAGTMNFSVTGAAHCAVVQEGPGAAFGVRQLLPADLLASTTNDNAPAGAVGEVVSLQVPQVNGVNLPTNTPVEVMHISLSPGDWDVSGTCAFFIATGTSVLNMRAGMNIGTAVLPDPGATMMPLGALVGISSAGAETGAISLGQARVSLAATTNIYMSARAGWSGGGGVAGYGWMMARRVR